MNDTPLASPTQYRGRPIRISAARLMGTGDTTPQISPRLLTFKAMPWFTLLLYILAFASMLLAALYVSNQ